MKAGPQCRRHAAGEILDSLADLDRVALGQAAHQGGLVARGAGACRPAAARQRDDRLGGAHGLTQQAHAAIREHIGKDFGAAVANAIPLLYGGSVKGDNAAELFAQPDIDGGLIGGASLKADEFLKIASAAKR